MIVDRIEGGMAVVEVTKGEFRDVPLAHIEGHVRDGAVLVKRGDMYVVDEDETARRAKAFREQRLQLFRKR